MQSEQLIVIPMAGNSSRFKRAGYDLPKYMLEARGCSLFEHSILSFKKYFERINFLFIILDVFDSKKFVEQKCKLMGVKNYSIIVLDSPTRGQAETVYIGLKKIEIERASITIFNIDTFRPNFQYPSDFNISCVDGYLETFVGSGGNWSNVLPDSVGSNKVLITAEKKQISEFCCTGLYYFNDVNDFYSAFEVSLTLGLNSLQGGEFYVAPLYNYLIESGLDIRFSIIDPADVIFCGVPEEYRAFL